MTYPRNGFTPSRQPAIDWIRRMPASAGGNLPICKGDAVYSLNGVLTACTAGTNAGNPIGYGIVLACYTTAGRPFTFNNTKLIASGTPGMVDVCFDPNQTYVVRCKSSVGASNIGRNCAIDMSGGAVNALLGISGQCVDVVASASTTDYFKLLNIAPFEELSGKYNGTSTGTLGAAGQGVEVRWNNHFLNAPTLSL